MRSIIAGPHKIPPKPIKDVHADPLRRNISANRTQADRVRRLRHKARSVRMMCCESSRASMHQAAIAMAAMRRSAPHWSRTAAAARLFAR